MLDSLINWPLSLFSALRKPQSTIDVILPSEQQLELIEFILAAGKRTDIDSEHGNTEAVHEIVGVEGCLYIKTQ